MPVPRDQVVNLGLQPLTFEDCKGLEVCRKVLVRDARDATGLASEETKRLSRPAYAVEQQCQYKAKCFCYGLDKIANRIPGAGNWDQ